VAWGLPPALTEALAAAIKSGNFKANVKIGWDPTHVEPADITLAQARASAPQVSTAAVRGRSRRAAASTAAKGRGTRKKTRSARKKTRGASKKTRGASKKKAKKTRRRGG
jgi:hypothetical protein